MSTQIFSRGPTSLLHFIYMSDFQTEHEKLNSQQKKAVDAIEGPVLVVAGPGTGKTQLLSARVANILQKTDTDASSILCLTFTNKAATNMRDRLSTLIGAEAHKVSVKTFHSFAAEIMNMYPEHFWNGARLSTAPDAVQIEIIQDILTELPLDNPLAMKFAGQFTGIRDVQQGLKLAKEAGLTPEKLQAIIELNEAYIDLIEPELVDIASERLSHKTLPDLQENVDSLPEQGLSTDTRPLLPLDQAIKESLDYAISLDAESGKATNTSKWKNDWIQTVAGQKGMYKERKRNAWWKALADVYAGYRQELHQREYYDYSDMLVEVISRLEQRDDLRADVQERFLYVLIDEFQDTNAAQMRLSHLVSDHHTAENKPNIMAVGDDDQSIYKFNGAELNNMLEFTRSYPSAQLIVLTENYRSSQDILDTAQKVIDHAEDRLVKRHPDITKDLTAKNPPAKPSVITHQSYESREAQLSGVVSSIQAKRKDVQDTIAVIARNHASLRTVAHLLLNAKAPVRYEQQQNILDHEIIKQVELLARTILAIGEGDKETVDYGLSHLLRHPAWGLSAEQLWRLATDNYRDPDWLSSLSQSDDESLSSLANWLHDMSQQNAIEPLPVLIEYLLGLRETEAYASPLREYFLDQHQETDDYLHGLSAIQLLRSSLQEFTKTAVQPTLSDLLRFIDVHRENEQTITDESPFVVGKNAVELLTVHKAKGLEYDIVYIIDAIEDNWQPRAGGRKPPANLPLQPYGDDDDDYARMMYVAVTRAKRDVIATSYHTDHAGEDVLATPLIRNSFPEPERIDTGNTTQKIEILEDHLRWPSLSTGSMKSHIKARLESYKLNVTNLLNFLDITTGGPDYFVERNLLRLPSIKTTSMAFGTAMHTALQEAQLQTNRGDFSLDIVLSEYEKALKSEHLTKEETARYRDHGKDVLQHLFTKINLQLPKGSRPEQSLSDIKAGSALLNGKLDRIDFTSKTSLRVIDYKTGKPLRNFDTKDKTQVVKAWRQKTQLIFYAVLLQNSPQYASYKEIEGAMIYLEAENDKEIIRSYTPTKEDIDRLQAIINAVFRRIKNLDFPDVSQYEPTLEGIKQFENDLIA